jgi:hypothetical protein
MDDHEFAEYVRTRYDQGPNDRLDRFGREHIESGDFHIRVELAENTEMNWGESHLGTAFGSCVDYGDRYRQYDKGDLTDEDLEDEARQRVLRARNALNFMHDKEAETVVGGVVLVLRENGYAIYPDPERLLTL